MQPFSDPRTWNDLVAVLAGTVDDNDLPVAADAAEDLGLMDMAEALRLLPIQLASVREARERMRASGLEPTQLKLYLTDGLWFWVADTAIAKTEPKEDGEWTLEQRPWPNVLIGREMRTSLKGHMVKSALREASLVNLEKPLLQALSTLLGLKGKWVEIQGETGLCGFCFQHACLIPYLTSKGLPS